MSLDPSFLQNHPEVMQWIVAVAQNLTATAIERATGRVRRAITNSSTDANEAVGRAFEEAITAAGNLLPRSEGFLWTAETFFRDADVRDEFARLLQPTREKLLDVAFLWERFIETGGDTSTVTRAAFNHAMERFEDTFRRVAAENSDLRSILQYQLIERTAAMTEHINEMVENQERVFAQQNIFPLDSYREQDPRHTARFVEDPERRNLARRIRELLLDKGGPLHVRLQGPPGVGKTRLALEALKGSPIPAFYAPFVPHQVGVFAEWRRPEPQTILIVDECDEGFAIVREVAMMSEGRLRLLTIGHQDVSGAGDEVFELLPVADEQMKAIVSGISATISPEQVAWIVGLSRGYVRLGVLLAEQVAHGRTRAVDLYAARDIRLLLEELVPDGEERTAMGGAALLIRFGWGEDLQEEGEHIAAFVGLTLPHMLRLLRGMEKKGLVSRTRRYLYVTPQILAMWLAADTLRGRVQEVRSFFDQLSEDGRRRFFLRLESLSELPEVRWIYAQLLGVGGPFDNVAALNERGRAELFFVLARGDRQRALETLESHIGFASVEELQQLYEGRMPLVRALEYMAQWRSTFFGAARLLLRLAEAENQTWANNATGTWIELFGIGLAETEVPAQDRLLFLDQLLTSSTTPHRMLITQAVERALNLLESGIVLGRIGQGELPPQSWKPTSERENRECRVMALQILDKLLSDADAQIRVNAREVLLSTARGLVRIGLIEEVRPRLETLIALEKEQENHDESVRDLWETIMGILRFERWLNAESRQAFEVLASSIFGDSLHDRIRRYVGRQVGFDWSGPDMPAQQRPEQIAAELATEAIHAPSLLRNELEWLTSGDAQNVWYFGVRLGQLDVERTWFQDILLAAQKGTDRRLFSAYVEGRAQGGEREWREHVLDQLMEEQTNADLVFDATWRGTPSDRAIERLIYLVDSGWIAPNRLRVLSYGEWATALTLSNLIEALERLIQEDSAVSSEVGLALIHDWLRHGGGVYDTELEQLVWGFLERPPSFGRSTMLGFYWKEVAQPLLAHDPVRLARAILTGVAEEKFWLESDEREVILSEALRRDPRGVWEVLHTTLSSTPKLALLLDSWAWKHDILAYFDDEEVLAWIRQDPETRQWLIAKLVRPQSKLSSLIRRILEEYGPDSIAADVLAANFGTSPVVSGSMAEYEQQQIKIATAWSNDLSPQVRAWARKVITASQRVIPMLEVLEEERELE